MGNDGSGKTTIAKKVYKFFRELGFKTYYKHEYEYAIIKFLFKLTDKKKLKKLRREMIVEKKKAWKYYIWPFLVWFDVLFQYLYFRLFRRQAIIILDRYPYDHYLSFKYLGYLTKVSEWLYLHFPKPDVGIILWVEPRIAYERKKNTHNYPLSFYEKQTKAYLNLSKTLKLPLINTNKEVIKTFQEVLKEFIKFVYYKGKKDLLYNIVIKSKKVNEKVKKISIIIPTFCRNEKLKKCLYSLTKAVKSIKQNSEIIVVDDSKDKQAKHLVLNFRKKLEKILSNRSKIKYIHSGGEKYPSYCRDLGLKKSSGKYILFVDDDNILSKNSIKRIISFLKSHLLVGVVGIVNYDPSGRIWSTGGKIKITPFSVILYNDTKIDRAKKIKIVDYVPNLYAIRRDVYFEVGGFDFINFPQAMEEVDLSLRVWRKGYIICTLINDDAYAIHLIDINKDKPLRTSRYYLRGKSRILLYSKHFKRLLLWQGIPDIILRAIKTLSYSIPLNHRLLLLRKYVEGIKTGLKERRK